MIYCLYAFVIPTTYTVELSSKLFYSPHRLGLFLMSLLSHLPWPFLPVQLPNFCLL
jgi:hypothetical protein